ncbi:MAG: type II secretion system F family protein [Pseudomonadota bacterium]|nr:type II secretion system F family protein [Pseudomonadota bacterium]
MANQAVKNALFVWEGKNKSGKIVKGMQNAPSEAVIRALLRRQGINPTTIKKQNNRASSRRKQKIRPVDIAIFSRQLATMIGAGVPLVQALDIVARGNDNLAMRELILSIRASIEGGSSLSEALAAHPVQFDDLFVNLVAAGEKSGALETLLDKIATYKEKAEAIKAKVRKALTYPTVVTIVAFVVTGILLYFVVPQFEGLFGSFGADLPAFTRLVINLSEFVRTWWWAILGSIGAIAAVLRYFNRTSAKFRRRRDQLLLRVPVIGRILHKAALARFTRTLSTMFAAGVPLVEAMESVAGATGNILFQEAVMTMREQVATGQQLHFSMQERMDLFPNMAIQMIAIGEESGSLDEMSAKVAEFYEAEVDNLVDNLSTLLEPLIMAILGVLVGGLVTAMYLPIFQMGNVI